MSEIILEQVESFEMIQESLIINEFIEKKLNHNDEELKLIFLVQDLFLEYFFP